ncbi:GAF domain-containing protein [Aequorivita sp. H23M31]|uniref:GAF domain-containing protein n=1 Tax=Aequorivita ciconiae TaxID=2494375 RepID=A0A410G7E0_9FLAO|nr:GAF domain-containing protein [Aequorivita sp. H23M31]
MDTRDFPMKIKIGFGKVFEAYRKQLNLDPSNKWTKDMLSLSDKYPALSKGVSNAEKLHEYSDQVDALMQPLFPTVFDDNEIKFATVPFRDIIIKSSAGYKELAQNAGKNFYPDLINLDHDLYYILGCSLIASHYYGKDLGFQRDFHCNIPMNNDLVRNFRVLYNTQFVEVEKSPDAPELKEEDFNELLESFDEIAVWKEKFPPQGYTFNGFLVATLIDITVDTSISDFKTDLLNLEINKDFKNTDFTRIFRSIFNLPDLQIGFADYNEETESFERVLFSEINSFLLGGNKSVISKEALCNSSYYTLFKQREFYVVTDAERYHKLYPNNILYKKLLDQGKKSAVFAAIVSDDRILGVLELVSSKKNELNTINANRLLDIMPFLVGSVVSAKTNLENELELIVQEECTSIHNSVHWKFRKEARRYLESISEGNPAIFREIVFQDVHPLYGQVDIKGSSEARNEATKQDLIEQLKYAANVIQKLNNSEALPIFEQMNFMISGFMEEIVENLQVDTERRIINFLNSEIIPFFNHLSRTNEEYKKLVEEYNGLIDPNTGLVYKHRKDYDESVMQVNKVLAGVLDKKQQHAQMMFPHYFERFKTDGVEHNLYIGASITKEKVFDTIYLKNLKLWQLQVICEMENTYSRFKDQLPVPLEVASMILAFNGSLSLRFRMDEKRFDVDGTYNARYEVVKKRVDKAHIKNTDERITKPGKLAIVYSQAEDEEEYKTYIRFLQAQQLLDDDVETVELEDLQGVTGLKAIRVSFLYSKNNKQKKEYYTYEDLISEIHD